MTTVATSDGVPVLEEIAVGVPKHRIVTDPDIVAGLSSDQGFGAGVGTPLAVVRAESADEVVDVVRACIRHRVPIVPRGAGTGLSGGANAVDGCVILSLERMDRVLRIDAMERLAVVQPGVVNDHLRTAAA